MAKEPKPLEFDDEDLMFAQIFAAAVGGVTATGGDLTPKKIAARAMLIADAAMEKLIEEMSKAAGDDDDDDDDDE